MPRMTASSPTRISVVVRVRPGVVDGARDDLGGPWSPPMASTATRTAGAVLVRWAARPGCVTASAGGVVGGLLQLDRETALVIATVRADVMWQLHLVAVRALFEGGTLMARWARRSPWRACDTRRLGTPMRLTGSFGHRGRDALIWFGRVSAALEGGCTTDGGV